MTGIVTQLTRTNISLTRVKTKDEADTNLRTSDTIKNLSVNDKHKIAHLAKFISIATRESHRNNAAGVIITDNKVKDYLIEHLNIPIEKAKKIADDLINIANIESSTTAGLKEWFLSPINKYHTISQHVKEFITDSTSIGGLGLSLDSLTLKSEHIDNMLRKSLTNIDIFDDDNEVIKLCKFFNTNAVNSKSNFLFNINSLIVSTKATDQDQLSQFYNQLHSLLTETGSTVDTRQFTPDRSQFLVMSTGIVAATDHNSFKHIWSRHTRTQKISSIMEIMINDKEFRKSLCQHMHYLNEQPHILYYNDYIKSGNKIDLECYKNNILINTGFSYDRSNNQYTYTGDNPANALKTLLTQQLLFLECKSAINLCIIMAIKDQLGDELFNEYVKNKCNNQLKLDIEFISNFPFAINQKHYYTPFQLNSAFKTSDELNNLAIGDQVYIAMPNGFALHPESELNGYNLFCCGFNENNDALFLGFHSIQKNPYTMTEIKQTLKVEFLKNLTYAELLQIWTHRSCKTAEPSSIYSYSDMYDLIEKNHYLDEVIKAYSLKDNLIELKKYSRVDLPSKLFKNTECVLVIYTNLVSNDQFGKLNTKILYNSIKYDTESAIENFTPQNETQQLMVKSLNDFQKHCIEYHQQFRATLVFGDPGLGKTHCCTEIIKELVQQGKKVWHTDYESKINADKIRHVYSKLSIDSENNKQVITTELEKVFAKEWEAIDIFYLDGVDKEINDSAVIAIAILDYAQKNNKQLIMNSNFNPYKIGLLSENSFIGPIAVIEVTGNDYRQQLTKWWENDYKPVPDLNKINLQKSFQKSSTGTLTISQIDLAKSVYRDLSYLRQTNQYGIIAICGKTGIGKTTSLQAMLKANNLNYIWSGIKDLNNQHLDFAQLEANIIVFDDINPDISDFAEATLLLKRIFNAEIIVNKYNQPLKIILISNQPKFELKEFLQTNLTPRMISRAKNTMQVYTNNDTKDFRLESDKRGCFVQNITNEKLIMDNPAIHPNKIFRCNITALIDKMDQNSQAELFNENNSLIGAILEKLKNHKVVVIEFDQLKLYFRLHEQLIMPILDYMEDTGAMVYFTCQAYTTQELRDFIYKEFTEDSLLNKVQIEKYKSRLNRIAVNN